MNFFGQKSGSTKSLTFQIRDGKQIVKDRVWKVRNPRSVRQMAQRCRLATVAQAYRYLNAIVDHSFQGMSGRAQNYARFSKLALDDMKSDMTKFAYANWGEKKFRPGAYQVSAGKLDPIPAFTIEKSGNALLLKSAVTGGALTEAQICEALGLDRIGAMVTILIVVPSELTDYTAVWVRAKRISNPSSNVLAQNSQMACLQFDASKGVVFSGFKYTSSVANIHIEVTTIPNSYLTPGADYCGNAVIRSIEADDGYQYSPATLIMGAGFAASTLNDFENACATYPTGETFVLQGGNGSVAPASGSNGGGSNNNGGGSENNGGGSSSTVDTPVIQGNTTFETSTEVTISAVSGAQVHYTLDGSDPTASSALYSSAITLTETTTVKAIAINGSVSSAVASKTFVKSSGEGGMDQN